MLPGYWMAETSGVLRPAIEAYLSGAAMPDDQIVAMRAYLRQWIAAPGWSSSSQLYLLRRSIDDLTTRERIASWLVVALDIGIDPL